MKALSINILAGFAVLGMVCSCVKNETPSAADITIAPGELSVGSEGGTESLFLQTESEWTASSPQDWISVSPESGASDAELSVTILANIVADLGESAQEREGEVVITLADKSMASVKIYQKAEALVLKAVYGNQRTIPSRGGAFTVTMEANCDYSASCDADWITVPTKASSKSENQFSATRNTTGSERKATLSFKAKNGEEYSINITQPVYKSPDPKTLKPCTVDKITDDMVFSTVCSGTLTASQQGFDFDPDTDMLIYGQLNNRYKNIISWPTRKITTSETACAYKMTLKYFSHVDGIHLEKAENGDYYFWIPNYGSRASNGKYTHPQTLSRVKMKDGKTLTQPDATDTYWFGTTDVHAAFDVDNDLVSIFSQYDGTMKIYRLSEVLAAPVKNITLINSIIYGGAESSDPEWAGKPVVAAHDCSTLKPVHSLTYSYLNMGRSWQTYTIYNGRIYFLLQYATPTNGMEKQSVIDVVDYNGNIIKQDIKQPFADDMPSLLKYNFTDEIKRTMEPEGIQIKDDVLYILYAAKLNSGLVRPVIFNFSMEGLE